MNCEVSGSSGVCLPKCQESEDLFASLEKECLLRTGAGMRVSGPEVREARLSESQKTGTPPRASRVDPLKALIGLSYWEVKLVSEEVDWKPLSRPPVTILLPRLTEGGCRLGRRQDEGNLKLEFPEHPSSAKN